MAKGFKSGGKNFLPGWKGGPGRPRMPSDLVEAKKINRIEFERIANEMLFMTRERVQEKIDGRTTPAINVIIGTIIIKACKHGDYSRLSFLLDRLIGKVKEVVEVSGSIGIDDLTPDERRARIDELAERLGYKKQV